MTHTSSKMRLYLNLLTLIVAFGHLSLMILALTHRLTYSVPPRYQLLEQTLVNPLWAILHGACFIAITVSVSTSKAYVPVLGAATGVMGSWVFLSLLWGLSAPERPSLAGPIMAGGMAVLSYALTSIWAHVPQNRIKGVL